NFSFYLSVFSDYSANFRKYNPRTMVILPSVLMNLKIRNINFLDFSLITVNSLVIRDTNSTLANKEIIFLSRNSSYFYPDEIQVKWNFPIVDENLSISATANETYFSKLFSSIDSFFIDRELLDIILIISESYFTNLISHVNQQILDDLTTNIGVKIHSFYFLNKTDYLYMLPRRVYDEYLNWSGELQTENLLFFGLIGPQAFIEVEIVFNDFLYTKMNQIFQKMKAILVSSLLIVSILASLFIFITYSFLKQNQKEQRQIYEIFKSRGVGFFTLNKRVVYLQILNIFVCLFISITLNIASLFSLKIIKWKYPQLLILLLHMITLTSISFLLLKLNSETNLKEIFQNKVKKEIRHSRSATLGIIIQVVSGTIAVLAAIVFWVINRGILRTEMLSIGAIWYISIGTIITVLSIVLTPKTIIKIQNWLFDYSARFFILAHRFITKALLACYKRKRKILALSFFLIVFSSFINMSFTSLQLNQENFYASVQLYDMSIVVQPHTVSQLVNYCEINECLVTYIDNQISNMGFRYFVFYLDNPLQYYKSSYFAKEYFREHTNREIFQILNDTSDYLITSSYMVKSRRYSIGENITIHRTKSDFSVVYETKTLLDFTYFLPFYSTQFSNWYLTKYDETVMNSTLFSYAIISIKDLNNSINSTLDYLNEKNLWYSILHNKDDFQAYEYPNEIFVNQLELPIILINILIPSIIMFIFIDVHNEMKKQLVFLMHKGLKNRTFLFSSVLWLFIYITLISILGTLTAVLALSIVFNISNSSYGLPFQLNFTWLSVLTPLIAIIVIMISPFGFSKFFKKISKKKNHINLLVQGDKKND
ncbi:MAG: hypothetical protein ACTSSF_08740, partial [Candidatus Heimdallarchaeaceae archaeon]